MREDLKSMKIYRAPAKGILNMGNNENFYSQWNTKLADEIKSMIEETPFLGYGPDIHHHLLEQYSKYIGVEPNQIMVGPGSENLISILFNGLLTLDQKILAPNPDFFRYVEVAKVLNRQILRVPLNDEDMIDQIIEKANREQVSLIILSTPNNPQGKLYPREDLLRLLENLSCYVVIDEAYAEFSGESLVDVLDDYPQLLIMRTLSKAFGLANLRVGFVLGRADVIQFLMATQGPFVVSGVTGNIASLVLNHVDEVKEQVKLICADRDDFSDYLKKIPEMEVYDSAANFVYCKHPKAQKIRQILLDDYKISIAFFAPDALRITIGTHEQMENLKAILDKIMKDL